MAATKTASVMIGDYTTQVTRAIEAQDEVIEAAARVAVSQNLDVLVKQDYSGRWQGFARRHSARGAAHEGDYNFDHATGRTAKKRDAKVAGGLLYLLEGPQAVVAMATGAAEVSLVDSGGRAYAYAVIEGPGMHDGAEELVTLFRGDNLARGCQVAREATDSYRKAMSRHGGSSGGYRVVRWGEAGVAITGRLADSLPTLSVSEAMSIGRPGFCSDDGSAK